MTKAMAFLIVSIVAIAMLSSAGPTLVALVHAVVPLVLALGVVIIGVRVAWHLTNRY